MERMEFPERLAKLRTSKNVSARDMSLSLGQSVNYITHIENGQDYPSMAMFFVICDYFGITPKEFFDLDSTDPSKANTLLEIAKSLSSEQLDTLITLAKGLRK